LPYCFNSYLDFIERVG